MSKLRYFHGRGVWRGLACVLLTTFSTGATWAQVPANLADYARTKTFTYNPDGTLQSETVEPNNAPSCVVTSYGYDNYGNVASTTVANCSSASGRAVFASRSTTSAFAAVSAQGITVSGSLTPNVTVAVPAGLVPTSSQNALLQSETRQYDPRFGALTQLTGPNGLTTSVVVDDFGRQIKELRSDGTSTLTWHCIIGASLDTSGNSVIGGTPCPSPAAGEAPGYAVRFVHSEARDASNVKMGPFVRIYQDKLGRQIRSATESFDGPNQASGRSGAVVASDIAYDQYGAKVIETQPYFLASGSSTTAGSNDVGATMLAYDELGRPIASYTVDPNANAAHTQTFGGTGPVSYGVYGSRLASTTTYAYNGLITTTTNDKGQSRTEEASARGEVLRVTDVTNAQVAFLPDAFGNVVQTLDALQNSVRNYYDYKGLKVQMNDPDKGVIVSCFDALGQLKALQNSNMRGGNTPASCPDVNDLSVNANGVVATAVANWATMAYDKLGRLTQRVEPEFSSTWSYDQYANAGSCNKGVGKLCEVVTSHGIDKKIVYDNLGREINNRTDVSGGPSFATAVSYDATTARLVSKTYPTGLQVGYNYTGRGFLQSLTLKTAATVNPLPNAQGQTAGSLALAANTVLWQANALDAKGSIEQDQLNNGVADRTSYEPATGRILGIAAGAGGASNVLSHQYTWDGINNLTARIDNNGDGVAGAVSENFTYDSLNRLSQYSVAAPAISGLNRTVTLQYNALGMLLYKSDLGDYTYGSSGPSAVRPHVIQSISGSSATSFTPDLNGNITSASSGKFSALAYTSFDNVASAAGAAQYGWQYDENHARIKETRVGGGNTRTLWYLHPDNVGGLGFESEIDTSPAIQSNRHFISAGGRAVGVLVSTGSLPSLAAGQTAPAGLGSITLNKAEYWHKDHLGSISATTDHLGNVTQRYAYDPFGQRRYANGRYDEFGNVVIDWSPSVNYGTARGFTGHEGLDDIGLVNMNGRLYDATVGVFVQADPTVTHPLNLQNYNRYAYVLNNPLNATDPSGFADTNVNLGASNSGDLMSKFADFLSSFFGGNQGSATTGRSDGVGSDGNTTNDSKQGSEKGDPGTKGHNRGEHQRGGWYCQHTDAICGANGGSQQSREPNGPMPVDLKSTAGDQVRKYERWAAEAAAEGHADLAARFAEAAKTVRTTEEVLSGDVSKETAAQMATAILAGYVQAKTKQPLAANQVPGRSGALNQAKRDLGVPRSQHPDSVARVPMTDRHGNNILGADGQRVMTREYTYTRTDGSKVVVQEHSAGHQFGQGGVGDQGPHFNVRPPENTRTGSVPGTQEHYPFTTPGK